MWIFRDFEHKIPKHHRLNEMIIVLFAVPMINDKRDSSRSISQTFFLATGNYSSTIPQPLAGNLIKFTWQLFFWQLEKLRCSYHGITDNLIKCYGTLLPELWIAWYTIWYTSLLISFKFWYIDIQLYLFKK